MDSRIILLIALIVFIIPESLAQGYVPMLKNTTWKCAFKRHHGPITPYTWQTKKDTLIGGNTYTIIENDITHPTMKKFYPTRLYLREDSLNKTIYYLDSTLTKEFIWYDFGMSIGDSIKYRANLTSIAYYLTLEKIDTISTLWGNRIVFHFDTLLNGVGSMQWMEGVGLINIDLDGPFGVFDSAHYAAYHYHALGCMYQNSVLFYENLPLPKYNLIHCNSLCPSIGMYDNFYVERTEICENDLPFRLAGPCDTSFFWSTLANPFDTLSVEDTLTVSPDTTTSYLWNGSLVTDTFTVTVYSNPKVDLGPDKEVCYNNIPVTLKPIVSDSNLKYIWFNSSKDSIYMAYTSRAYILKVENNYGCYGRDTMKLTVRDSLQLSFPADSVFIGQPPFTLWSATPTGGTYYGPGVYNGQFYPDSVGIGSYTLYYAYTDGFSCTDTVSTTIEVYQLTSLEEHSTGINFQVYPNPTNGKLNVKIDNLIYNVNLVIKDVRGSEQFATKLSAGVNQINIDFLKPGIYYYHIMQDGQILKNGKLIMAL